MSPEILASLDGLPDWARRLSEKYYSRTLAMFVLHGNVHDLLAWKRGRAHGVCSPAAFLEGALFGRRDLVLSYDRGGGIGFAKPETRNDFQRAIEGYDTFHGTKFAQGLPRNPDGVLAVLDSYLRVRVADGKKIAVLSLAYADMLAPAGDASGMGSEDRNCLVILKRWAQNQVFQRADVTICLMTESLTALNSGLVQNPAVAAIEIPLPDEADRIEFVRWQLEKTPFVWVGGECRDAREAGRRAEAGATAERDRACLREPAATDDGVSDEAQEGVD